jgi:putative transposase
MARLARIVIPGLPHHVTQRGNRREPIFFQDGDHEIYKDLLAEQVRKWDVQVWAYCLMPNHVHLILTPATGDGLGRAVGEAHRRYTNFINARGPLDRASVSKPLCLRGNG